MSKDVLIELEPERAAEFVAALRDKGVETQGPVEKDSLDGLTLASIIVTVTPVVAPYIIELIQALKGGIQGTIRTPTTTLDLKNATGRQLKEILAADKEEQ